MSGWQTVGGLTKGHFPLAGADWTGPERAEARLADNDDVNAIRGIFTRPDGSRRMAEVTYLKSSTKHRFYNVSPHTAPETVND